MKEVLISGDRVTVLGEFEGTPDGGLFGVPHSGKSFRVMTLDVQTIKDGKIVCTFHMELSALNQLSRSPDTCISKENKALKLLVKFGASARPNPALIIAILH